MNETPVSETIQETWQALVPIIELAQNESCAAILTMIEGADDFSEGMFDLWLENFVGIKFGDSDLVYNNVQLRP